MSRWMRLIVFFDLPVQTKVQRRAATHFRQSLLKDGYYMLQYSVYVRICNGIDAIEKHRARLRDMIPDDGSVRALVVTEKQYESIDILLGKPTIADESFQTQQLTVF